MTTLVDTNVLVDVIKADPDWMAWSARQLSIAARAGPLAINLVVYAELHTHDTAGPQLDSTLDAMGFAMADIDKPSVRMAARAFREYRRRGGTKTGVLPDFFIGAHALSQGWTLLARDAGRYRSYFPGLSVIAP